MKKLLILLPCLWLTVTSCKPKEETATAETPALNTLTAEQEADGWKLLFDGKTMEGWRAYKNAEVDCWDVQDNALHCKSPEAATKRGDILTVGQYENYELVFEWKISPGGNSGVIYRASEEFDAPYYSGPEYQVIDNTGYEGGLTELQKAASNYDMHAAGDQAVKPAGEWNEGKIVVNGAHCEHWLNGVKVVDYEFGSDDWQKRKDASKWKDVAGYGKTSMGHIDLQDHGHEVWYRNIRIKAL